MFLFIYIANIINVNEGLVIAMLYTVAKYFYKAGFKLHFAGLEHPWELHYIGIHTRGLLPC